MAGKAMHLPDGLIREHYALVAKIVGSMRRRLPSYSRVETDDLMQAGYKGLVDAAIRCKPALVDKFKAYAEYKIRKAIIDELRVHDPVKRHVRQFVRNVKREEARLGALVGRAPTDEEVASGLGLPLRDFQRQRDEWKDVYPVSYETTKNVASKIVTEIPNPDDILFAREQADIVRRKLKSLPKKMRIVLRSYYFDGMGMEEIGRKLGVTLSRVSQIRKEAIFELRDRFEKSHRKRDILS